MKYFLAFLVVVGAIAFFVIQGSKEKEQDETTQTTEQQEEKKKDSLKKNITDTIDYATGYTQVKKGQEMKDKLNKIYKKQNEDAEKFFDK